MTEAPIPRMIPAVLDPALPAIEICDVWKSYRTGAIRGRTLMRDFDTFLARVFGREDPNTQILDRGAITRQTTRRNRRFWAVRGVSFTIAKGEVVAVLGRNGAGKSTLLQVLCRITEADRGVIRIRGKIASLLGAGVGFNDELTGRENVYLNGSILGMTPSEIASRMESIAAFAEIPEFMDTPVKRYSSGMKARLGFAVAVHLDADIMILDEVFATGDRIFRMKCIDRIGELAKEGRTILIVTHIPEMLQGMCNRGIVLEKGSMVLDGPIDAAIERYVSKSSDSSQAMVQKEASQVNEDPVTVDFQRFALEDSSGDESLCVHSGERIRVCIALKTKEAYASLGAVLWIRAKTLGTLIQLQSSPGCFTGVQAGERIVMEADLDGFPLNPQTDEYSILLRVFCGGDKYRILAERVLPFDVVGNDSGQGRGHVRCSHHWHYRRENAAITS